MKRFKTIPIGKKVWWHYRSAIGHGKIAGIYKMGTNAGNTIYNIREFDHHLGERNILHHYGRALHISK